MRVIPSTFKEPWAIHFTTVYNVSFERTGDLRFILMMGMLLDQIYRNIAGGRSGVKPIGRMIPWIEANFDRLPPIPLPPPPCSQSPAIPRR